MANHSQFSKRISHRGLDEVHVFVGFHPLLEYVSRNGEWGCHLLALGSPHLKGDTEGKVSDAHKDNKKHVCFLKLWT